MAKTTFKLSTMQIISLVCLFLMIAMVVAQFLPFWTYSDKNDESQSLSVFGYVMFPNEKAYKSVFLKDMKVQLVRVGLMEADTEAVTKLSVNDFAYPHAILMLVSLFAIAFGPFKLGKPLGIAFNLAVGILGIYQYLSHPMYQLGSVWYFAMILAITLTVAALLNATLYIMKKLDKI